MKTGGFSRSVFLVSENDQREFLCVQRPSSTRATQERDGYLGSYRTTDDRKQDYNAFCVAWAVRALMAFHEATGRVEVLEACRRGLLWFVTNWKKHKPAYCGPMIIESLVEVFQHTGDRRLLEWAEEYMAALERQSVYPDSVSGSDYGQTALRRSGGEDRFQRLTGREKEGWARDCLHEFAQSILRHVRIQNVCQPPGRGSLCAGLSRRLLPRSSSAGSAGIRSRPLPY